MPVRSVARMITGIHTLVYSSDPPATRAFFRDVIGWAAMDWAEGWPLFAQGPAEGGVHPDTWPGQEEPVAGPHELTLMCDDLDATVAELATRGARFHGEVQTMPYGRVIAVEVPGIDPISLLEPNYPPAWENA